MKNINTLNAMLAEAKRISAANAAAPAPEHVQAMHDLHENAKAVLTRDEYTQLWEAIKPAASGVDGFAGRKWRAAHPDAQASAMPGYIAQAQAERKAKADAAKADKPAQPKAEKATKAKAKADAQPKADKPAAKAKAPTQREMLAALLLGQQQELAALNGLTKAIEKLAAK